MVIELLGQLKKASVGKEHQSSCQVPRFGNVFLTKCPLFSGGKLREAEGIDGRGLEKGDVP